VPEEMAVRKNPSWKYVRSRHCRLNPLSAKTFSLYVHRAKDGYATAAGCSIRIIGDVACPQKARRVARRIVDALNRGVVSTESLPRHIDARKEGSEYLSRYKEKDSIVDCKGNLRKSNRGELHGRAKLKERDVIWILKNYVREAKAKDDDGSPKSLKGIAEKFNVKKETISRIVNGKLWHHLFVQVKGTVSNHIVSHTGGGPDVHRK